MRYRVLFILNLVYAPTLLAQTDPCSGLKLQQLSSNSISSYLRCADESGTSNPQWSVNNNTRYQEAGLASIKLMGVGFTVLDIHWMRIRDSSVEVSCMSKTCRLSARVTRAGAGRSISSSDDSSSTTRTSTTTSTTTRPPTTTTTKRTA